MTEKKEPHTFIPTPTGAKCSVCGVEVTVGVVVAARANNKHSFRAVLDSLPSCKP